MSKQQWNAVALTLCGGGSLSEYRSSTNITEPIARYLFYHIVLGLRELHKAKIAHMDLRLENILIDNDGDIRICDFGNSLGFQKLDDDLVKSGTVAGTVSHMAPEMLGFEEDYHAKKADMWCCGLVLYELLTGQQAFQVSKNDKNVVQKILSAKFEPIGLNFSQEARLLCNMLLDYEPSERPDCDEVLAHPWLQKEMHKPAIAKGIVLLDPAPEQFKVEKKLTECLNKEGLTVTYSNNQGKYMFKLKCKQPHSGLVLSVTAEFMDQNDHDSIEMIEIQQRAIQTQQGKKEVENMALKQFASGAAIKLTFFMRSGILWEFQKLFRRVRYVMLEEFGDVSEISGDNERIDDQPAVDVIYYRAQSMTSKQENAEQLLAKQNLIQDDMM
ncbi:Kinase [Hexamita inflata]|uniref:Kinase n=1 Tax=Hexamita inflata TaxID=28002 RepID=A0AA86P1L1_9EUKA|nr:Kinase [Hexamita inflata]